MSKKILVTGGTGMLGQALQKIMPDAVYVGLRQHHDLRDFSSTVEMFRKYSPDIVIHLAAKVAGLEYNMANPVTQLNSNVLINTNVFKAALDAGVGKLLAMASTCIYPDKASRYPMTEDMLHEGMPPLTNLEYAYAKRLMCVQIEAYNKQYGTQWSYLIPSNMYGPGDNYKPGESHFIGTMIREIYNAKRDGLSIITLLGTGSPFRQFIYSEDVARVIKKCIDKDIYTPMNVAYPHNISYKYIADIVLRSCNAYNISINWDRSKPDGQYRKDVTNLKLMEQMGGVIFTKLEDGVKSAYDQYIKSKNEST